MKFSRKTMTATITLVLTLTIAATLIAFPAVNAHDPPWTIHSWAYITAAPNPVGVGQTTILVFWSDYVPPTASGQYGDRWTFHIYVTKPDGSEETLGPITSDPVGGGWTDYVPDQTGTYTFVAHFDEVVLGTTGIYPPEDTPLPAGRTQYFGDIQEAATSDPETLIVQSDPIQSYPTVELPTDYWERPISPLNREWASIAGSWLADGVPNMYTTAPKTAHILWTRPSTFGGIVGGERGSISYHTGSAYEAFSGAAWSRGRNTMMIINGRLYYSEPKAPRYGWYCVDIRTGELLFWKNSTGPIQIGSDTGAHISSTNIPWLYPTINFGQIFEYDSPNQHGARAYLWSHYRQPEDITYSYEKLDGSIYSFSASEGSDVWQMIDAFTGNWICNLANAPASSAGGIERGPNGEILVYDLDDFELSIWNSTVALGWPNNNLGVGFQEPGGGGSTEAYYWMWREPIGETVDGNNGWQTPIAFDAAPGDPGIDYVGSDIILCSDIIGDQLLQYGYSMKPGEEGTLLWQENRTIPYPQSASSSRNRWRMGAVGEGVYTMNLKEDLQWYGFDLYTGEQIWGPSEKQTAMDLYGMGGVIWEGKLLSGGYGGIIYAYDLQNGQRLWSYSTGSTGLESAWPNWPIRGSFFVADGKIYATTDEHSHTQPLYRGWAVHCVDANTGEGLWTSPGLYSYGALAAADGYLIGQDSLTNQYICFGKGKTTTTIEAPLTAVPKGTSMVIRGTVTDQSPGAKDTPAIADTDMSEWMEYLYMQQPIPMDATGVPVTIDAIDPDGNFFNIGTTTSDMTGLYSLLWEPPDEGLYTIIATFEGSDSYFASYSETAIAVGPVSPGVEPTTEPPTTAPPTSAPPPTGEAPLISTETAIAISVAIAAVIGIAAYWAFRRRQVK